MNICNILTPPVYLDALAQVNNYFKQKQKKMQNLNIDYQWSILNYYNKFNHWKCRELNFSFASLLLFPLSGKSKKHPIFAM